MMNSGGIGVPLGFPLGPTSVIQVTNLSSAVTSEQMRTLFGFLGDIEELRLYPPDNAPLAFSSKVCYIKFREASSVGVAQHLTNTVFIDRALIVVPCAEGKIPDEAKALSLLAPAPTMTSLMPGAGLLPIPTPTPLTTLGVSLGTLGTIPAAALDPNITALGEIPQPPIIGNVDPSKIDEIRRTVYVGNLNSQTTTADQLLEFFKQVGEVKFVRMAGDETQPTRFAFVEFADQNSVPRALAFNGVMFGDRPLKINHSNNAIVKPPEMTPQAAAKELEEVMKRVREAQSFISAAIEPESGKNSERKGGRSRSHSRSESRSSSKSWSRRKRSHSKHRDKKRDKEKVKEKEKAKERDQDKEKERNRNRDQERERERDKERNRDKDKERDWEREKERNKDRGRVRDKDKDKYRDREKAKDNEKEEDREEVDQNKEKYDVEKEGEKDREKIKDKEGDKGRGDKEKDRDKEKEKDEDKEKKEQESEKERDDKNKKEKRSRTPPRSYSSSRRSRSSSRERRKRKSRSPSKSPKRTKRKSSQTPSPRRNKKEKKREKDTNNERREGEHSTSKKKSSKEKEGKEKSDKSTTTFKDKHHTKEDLNSETDKEVGNRDTQETDEVKLQQNGNCQPNDENLSIKMEEV
ncbi:splicing regulatory glutamine/lysine-rich protein 1-like isoform X3 [Falco biarmicus]|nr:splicing regulatory glutamine/lysine-rich protein 1-like isoform X3 [Falco cherrug]XP_055649037.1 splicing regulatory glutamine/lysine-rich protein 1-like isoform X3 [Falco peregrinus]XP_056179384.1 splicing regulatory glutamine/lysine-rich protein 1-like isoform X3 [Falco biarmicus]